MSREGVAIKVKIGLRPNGHADHPLWAILPMVQGGITPESQIIVDWKYDKCCGHKEDNGGDSPAGMQWGMVIVTEQFANEALVAYPSTITKMTEAEAKAFWNNKACAHIPKDKVYSKALSDFNAELALKKAVGQNTASLEARIIKALDRNDDSEQGVHKNKGKDFDDAKTHHGFTIKKP